MFHMHVADVTEIHYGTELTESVNEITDVGTDINESATNKSLPKETFNSDSSKLIIHVP